MSEERKTIFEGRVNAGRNTFFIDARQAVNQHYYLTITDSRRQDDGTFQQQKVLVFEESVKGFRETVNEACSIIEKLAAAASKKRSKRSGKPIPGLS